MKAELTFQEMMLHLTMNILYLFIYLFHLNENYMNYL